MKPHVILSLIGGVLIGAAITLSLFGSDKETSLTKETTKDDTHAMHEQTVEVEDQTELDRAFIEMMIPHHEEAVASARTVLRQGGSTKEIRDLAQAIIIAQEDEIEMMKNWYQTWYGESYSDTGVYTPMMRDVSNLQGSALDAAFLEDMVEHHLHAITMAHDIAKATERPELLTLAQNIATDQSNEIVTMKTLLKQLSTSTSASL
jgi:uncharacterized protein (DUF305 family)